MDEECLKNYLKINLNGKITYQNLKVHKKLLSK